MERQGVYLYGFVPRGTTLDLGRLEGIDESGPVRALDLGGSTAVVVDVDLDAFEMAMTNGPNGGPDPDWVVPRALRHERVLDVVLDRSPVLPVRFGALFSSVGALAAMAAEHDAAIALFLESLGDKREWSLRGYVDLDAAADRLLEADPELSARRARLPDAPGARYFQEKKLREDARREARRAASAAPSAVRRALRAVATDVRTLPLRSDEDPRREMILHEAVLLARGTEPVALADAERAATEAVSGLLTLEPTGPWPPFHFCPGLDGSPK